MTHANKIIEKILKILIYIVNIKSNRAHVDAAALFIEPRTGDSLRNESDAVFSLPELLLPLAELLITLSVNTYAENTINCFYLLTLYLCGVKFLNI